MTALASGAGHVAVGPLRMYYDVEGSGRPLLLLHGGLNTIAGSFAALRPALARRHTTIAVEQQAHGHTADVERPLRYEQMVDDTAALVRALHITGADVFGWSDGGIVALGLAARHPALANRIAIFGASYRPDGETGESHRQLAALNPADEDLASLRAAYTAVAPRPADWPILVAKIQALPPAFAGWPEAELRSIAAPFLIMIGDDDIVRPEHALALRALVTGSRLAVLPGTDHFGPVTRAPWILSMLADFYDAAISVDPRAKEPS
jgi:pimeloyl-ACP methyl ester carboxylesterase